LLANRRFLAAWQCCSLLKQDLAATALPGLSPILAGQDADIAQLERDNPNRRRLMRLVRHNSLPY
jgi:hypothetical protein